MSISLPRLYALCAADDHQCAQVVVNSLRHDRRLLDYLAAAPAESGTDHSALRLQLQQFEDRLVQRVLTPTRIRVAGLQAAADPPAVKEFARWRSGIGKGIRSVLLTGGTVHNALRGRADTTAPDMTIHWTRLETSDARSMAFLQTLAHCTASRLAAWFFGAGLSGSLEPKVNVALDFGHLPFVHNRHTVLPEKCETEPLWPREINLFITVPFWMLDMLRFSPVLVHETSHPFSEFAARASPRMRDVHSEAMGLVRRCLEIFTRSEHPNFSSYAHWFLTELLSDALAYRLVGVSYLLSLAIYSIGSKPFQEDDDKKGYFAVPLSVRLRLLSSLVADHRAQDERTCHLLRPIQQQVQQYLNHVSVSQPGFRSFQDDALFIGERYVRTALDLLGAPPPCQEHLPGRCRVCDTPDDLWRRLDEQMSVGADLMDVVRTSPEIFIAEQAVQDRDGFTPSSSSVKYGGAWELQKVFVRAPPPGAGGAPRRLEGLIRETMDVFDPRGVSRGMVGAILGPCDLVVLRQGARNRSDDGISDKNRSVATYLQRRLMREMVAISDAAWRPGALGGAASRGLPNLMSEVRLCQGQDPGRFLQQALGSPVVTRGDVRLVRAFHASGWFHLCLLWSVTAPKGVAGLHRQVLAPTEGCLVERSVTHLFTLAAPFGNTPPTASWEAGAWPPLRIHASLRTQDASGIGKVNAWFQEHSSGVPLQIDTVLGLHDVLARIEVRSAADLQAMAELLWRGIRERIITRSVCHLELTGIDDVG